MSKTRCCILYVNIPKFYGSFTIAIKRITIAANFSGVWCKNATTLIGYKSALSFVTQ